MVATGEFGGFQRTWDLPPEQAERLWQRARLPGSPADHRLAYTDRHGVLHLPYEVALRFAQGFAAAEPEPCLLYLKDEEDRLRAEGYQPGERFAHEWLRQRGPAWALVRDWASRGEVDLLREEIRRLQGLVNHAAGNLERLGDTRAAERLRRALGGR